MKQKFDPYRYRLWNHEWDAELSRRKQVYLLVEAVAGFVYACGRDADIASIRDFLQGHRTHSSDIPTQLYRDTMTYLSLVDSKLGRSLAEPEVK